MVEIKTALTGGIEMDYCCFGRGKKVFVILPGLSVKKVSPYGESLSQAFGAFTEDYRVYLFDRRTNAPTSYSIEDMAEDTAAVIQNLGIKRISLFGASQGGMIAQCMAIRYPDLVEKLVLGSTFCRSNDTAQKVIRSWIGLAEEERGYDLNQAICKSIYSQATMDSYGEVLLSVGDRITPEEMKRFIPFAQSIVSFDVSSGLDRISCPVLVLACEEDRVTTLTGAKEIVERLHCECYVYGREYGHAVFDEAADYRPRILEFLRK